MPEKDYVTVSEVREQLERIEEWLKDVHAAIDSMRADQRLTTRDEIDAWADRKWQPLTKACTLPMVPKKPGPGPESSGH